MLETSLNVNLTDPSEFHSEAALASEKAADTVEIIRPKRRKTLSEQHDALLEKRARLDSELKKIKAQEKQLQGKLSAQKRRENDHRKIIVGGYVEAALGHPLTLAAPGTPGASKKLSPESAVELSHALNHGIASGATDEETRRFAVSRSIDDELGRDVSADEAAGLVRVAIATARIHEEAAHDPETTLSPEVAAVLTDEQRGLVEATLIGTKVQEGIFKAQLPAGWETFCQAADLLENAPTEKIDPTGLTDKQAEILRLVQIALILERRSGVKIRNLDAFGNYCSQYSRALSSFADPSKEVKEAVLSMFSEY